MKTAYIFDHKDYFHALQPQIGGGFAVYAGTRQRGGGLGGVLGALVKYGIPIAKKYILPHAKDAFLRTVADITSDRSSAKESVKNNSKRLIKDIGSSIVSKLVQDGSGLSRKRKYKTEDTKFTPILKKKQKLVKNNKSKKAKKSPSKKTDFISTCL